MTQIFIAFTEDDYGFATNLSEALEQEGHDVRGTGDIEVGGSWHDVVENEIQDAEAFIALVSDASLQSQYFMRQVGAVRSYSSSSERILILPIVIDNIPVPPLLNDIQALIVPERDIRKVVDGIQRAIAAFVGRRAAQKERDVQVAQRIEQNAASFIDDAVQAQTFAEGRNRFWGTAWYIGGFVALLCGLAFAAGIFLIFHKSSSAAQSTDVGWPRLIETILQSVMVIGFLAACARYAFSLGKSYISEALKCSDRIHAIAFGKFYLRAFGEKATWPELKEVFQHWNIDRASAFSSLNVSEIDPQILSMLGSLARGVASKSKAD